MAGVTRTSTTRPVLLLALVALASLADLAAAARPVDPAAALPAPSAVAPATAAELEGVVMCMLGCFTQVFGCSFGCVAKGPNMPLCVISCNQKALVCMLRCGISPPSPPPPAPTPTPTPTPPSPRPRPPSPRPRPPSPHPKPPRPTPSPPPGPPYAADDTETSA